MDSWDISIHLDWFVWLFYWPSEINLMLLVGNVMEFYELDLIIET